MDIEYGQPMKLLQRRHRSIVHKRIGNDERIQAR